MFNKSTWFDAIVGFVISWHFGGSIPLKNIFHQIIELEFYTFSFRWTAQKKTYWNYKQKPLKTIFSAWAIFINNVLMWLHSYLKLQNTICSLTSCCPCTACSWFWVFWFWCGIAQQCADIHGRSASLRSLNRCGHCEGSVEDSAGLAHCPITGGESAFRHRTRQPSFYHPYSSLLFLCWVMIRGH